MPKCIEINCNKYASFNFIGEKLHLYCRTHKTSDMVNVKAKYTANSQTLYINLIHVFLFAPLIIYIGYNAKKTPRSAYEMLGLITFSALGYHIYNMIVLTQIIDVDD